MKKIYFAMTTHPNMNYDRSLRSVIWDAFPKLYRLYLNYLRDRRELKSHMQLPPQTLLSLKQCAPDVIELAQALRREGRLRFMGTFLSESIAQCQDGMSMLDAAELGCGIAAEELAAELEGFFLQEIAYTPQLPYVINKVGVQWTIIRDWDNSLKPFRAVGLDGSQCIAVPLMESAQRQQIVADPSILPDNALLITHCDMEIPVAIKRMHELEILLRETHGFETEWCFVSDYIRKVGVDPPKHPTPCTNKAEGTAESPSFSRWCADHLSMQVHAATLSAMEARRAGSLAAFGRDPRETGVQMGPHTRPYTTWEVENPWLYPELREFSGASDGSAGSAFRRMAMLIAWGCNSDGRGWYPLLERRFERTDSFHEAELLGDSISRACIAGLPIRGARVSPALIALNPHGPRAPSWMEVHAAEQLALLDENGEDAVQLVRRRGNQWEHLVRLDVPPYAVRGFRKISRRREAATEIPGTRIGNGAWTASFVDGALKLERPGQQELSLGLDPFRIFVKCLDSELRDPEPEGDWRVTVIEGQYPRIVACRQLDYHIHFRAEYTLDHDRVFADWRFYFTYPTLVDSLDDFDAGGPKTDFVPGGLCASVRTGGPGDVWYDGPFGVLRHANARESFVPPLTHAFLEKESGTVALVTQSGSQSFKVNAAEGRIGICMGKSITSGGRRKLHFRVGESIEDYSTETEWYKEFFCGELRHRFVIQHVDGDWRDCALPNLCRTLAHGVRALETAEASCGTHTLAKLTPENVRLAGLDPDTGRIVLCEMCGRATDFRLQLNNTERSGKIGPFGIVELS